MTVLANLNKIRCLFLACAIFFILLIPARAAEPLVPAANAANEYTVRTKDGVFISLKLLKNGRDAVIIICHGFYNSKENRWMKKTAAILSSKYDVIMLDMRGHGKSGGEYTWSAKEDMDIDAVVDYAISRGYKRIGMLAFSLGAASAIKSASERSEIGSMVLISCPYKFEAINYHFWEPSMLYDLADNFRCGWQGKGARGFNMFMRREKPIDSVRLIKDTPILFVHGDNDWVIKESHSKKLFEAARCPKKIEIIKGGMHAERLIESDPEGMKSLIAGWFDQTLK